MTNYTLRDLCSSKVTFQGSGKNVEFWGGREVWGHCSTHCRSCKERQLEMSVGIGAEYCPVGKVEKMGRERKRRDRDAISLPGKLSDEGTRTSAQHLARLHGHVCMAPSRHQDVRWEGGQVTSVFTALMARQEHVKNFSWGVSWLCSPLSFPGDGLHVIPGGRRPSTSQVRTECASVSQACAGSPGTELLSR